MKINYIIWISLISLIFADPEPQTGWDFDQSTQQSFYLFDDITIDGDVVVGDGSGEGDGECSTSGECDVVGAFRRGVCSDPIYQWSELLCTLLDNEWNTDEEICIGWRYADSNGATTVALMGREGSIDDDPESDTYGEYPDTYYYANQDESAYLKIYDASNGSILELTPSSELPGWLLNEIWNIDGTSTANNTFGCTDSNACNFDDSATADDGSCLENDCVGECGGSAEVDECGVCNGDGSSCAGVDGCTDPEACNYDPEATEDDGSCLENDCAGVCGGDSVLSGCDNECNSTAYVDMCGTCDDDASNDCVQDCGGTWGGDDFDQGCGCGVYDELPTDGCDDVCGSTATEDMCGTCDDDSSNDCVQDCAGTWGGSEVLSGCDNECSSTAYEDMCGTCDDDPFNDCEQDCAGIWGGDAEYDNCDVCDDDSSNDCVQDCAGIWGGDAEYDNCETCDDDPSNDCVEDCAGTWGGDAVNDMCNTCDNDPSNDCEQDCAGTWGGSEVLSGCDNECSSTAYVDECGTCDDDSSNDCVQDCAGTWGGSEVLSGCDNECSSTATEDMCGTCDDDSSNDCVQDCAGTWGGSEVLSGCDNECSSTAYEDMCGTCDDDPFNDCEQDCAGTWGGSEVLSGCDNTCSSTAEVDECGVCDGQGAIYGDSGCCEVVVDDCGVCNGGNADMDDCGVCGGDGSSCSGVDGCTDSSACNYNPDATNDDGSCLSNDCAGECGGSAEVDECGICDSESDNDCAQVNILLDGLDLVSFYALPEDNSIGNVLGGIEGSNPGVLSESSAAYFDDGEWFGGLLSIDRTDGYWIKVSDETELVVEGLLTDPETIYSLHGGVNLISYPFAGFSPLIETIPEEAQNSIIGLIAEGESAYNTEDGWIGGLMDLSGTEGYWFITSEDVEFTYNPPVASDNLTRQVKYRKALPEAYTYAQSINQAFYFVNDAEIDGDPLTTDDLIIAYNGDVVVGARYWYGEATDIPAMGADGDVNYAGYSIPGDKITFKVLDTSTNTLIEMESKGETTWQNLGMSVIQLTNKLIPEEISFGSAYPNPFNPVTTVSVSIPAEMEVHVAIHDMLGRKIVELANGVYSTGNYELQWDASNNASGVYFVKMIAGGHVDTQKLMLLK